MTYEIVNAHLNNNHFYPILETKSGKIISLQISISPILLDSKKERVEEILQDYPVVISVLKKGKEIYLLIKLKNKK